MLPGRANGAVLAATVDGALALVEVVHREVNALQLAPGDLQVARRARAGREHDRVELRPQVVGRDVTADLDAVSDLDPLGGELLHAALDGGLLDLELRHAEANEPAGGLVALEQHDGVPGAAQLLRRGHAGGAGADDGDAHAGLDGRRLRPDPTLGPRAVDDRVLDLLDRDGVALVDLEHARGLARRGAQAPGELGEVVGRVQLADRVLPAIAVHEVVPIGDQVP